MKKVTRKQVQGFLSMYRKCLHQLRSGEIDSIDDNPVYHIENDDYIEVDLMFEQLYEFMEVNHKFMNTESIRNIVMKISNNVALTVKEVESALTTLKEMETFICKTTSKKQANDIILKVQIEDEFKRLEII